MTNSPKILLIGAQGQVGQELQQTLPQIGEVVAVARTGLDLSQSSQIRQVIRDVTPHYIVNAGAYTAVDKAESEPELAYQINAIAPTIIAEEAQNCGASLIHISTDYVFDGTKNTPYLEEDATHPLSVYGKSKLAGEKGIQAIDNHYCILRTAWVYGTAGKGNFVKTMLRLAQEREELRIVIDQVGTPTWSRDIAQTITELLKHQVTGIYHFTNSGVISWYDFAIAIFEEARQRGASLAVKRVIPITTAEYPTPATRPAYSVLSGKKITPILGNCPPYWRDSLKAMLNQND